MKNSSIINSYRLNPTPTPPASGVTTGTIRPAITPPDYRRALVVLAALLLPLLAVGVVVYAARAVQPAPVAVPAPGVVDRVVEATPVVIERVVEVQASPVVIIVTPTAPPPARVIEAPRPVQAQAQPAAPAFHPTPAPQPTRPPAHAAVAPLPSPTWTVAPVIERALSRGCPDRRCSGGTCSQGTIIQNYYTDANGQPRPAMCRVDGWKDTE